MHHLDRAVDAFEHAVQQYLRFFHDVVGTEQGREHCSSAFAFFTVAGGAVGFVNFLPLRHLCGIGGEGWGGKTGECGKCQDVDGFHGLSLQMVGMFLF